jgi:hypothetical protein
VIHLALGSVVNAIWDLWAKTLNKPVWQVVAEMTPEEFVRCIDFRYITDAITPEEAIEMLKNEEGGKAKRIQDALNSKAVPAYTTSAGWLGYGEDKMKGLLQETLAKGYKHFKLKVGTSIEADVRRLTIAREVIGYDKGNILMVDANQVSQHHSILISVRHKSFSTDCSTPFSFWLCPDPCRYLFPSCHFNLVETFYPYCRSCFRRHRITTSGNNNLRKISFLTNTVSRCGQFPKLLSTCNI